MNIQTQVCRDLIQHTARSYVDVPFLHLGRSRKGVDCVGLIVCVARDLDLSSYDVVGYSRFPNKKLFIDGWNNCPDIQIINPALREPGDILIFAMKGLPCHCGIQLENEYAIHSMERAGRVCVHRLDAIWRHAIQAVYRFKEVV